LDTPSYSLDSTSLNPSVCCGFNGSDIKINFFQQNVIIKEITSSTRLTCEYKTGDQFPAGAGSILFVTAFRPAVGTGMLTGLKVK
jgi:hypothetical protein